MNDELDLTADVIDVRNIIARVETLEDECDPTTGLPDGYKLAELKRLHEILEEISGVDGDQKWRVGHYPLVLINESHFTDYARELLEDCGARFRPHYIQIDWRATARNLRTDYTCIEILGRNFYYR